MNIGTIKKTAILVALGVTLSVTNAFSAHAAGVPPTQQQASGPHAFASVFAGGTSLIGWADISDSQDVLMTPGATFTQVPNMIDAVTIPATVKKATIRVQFDSESACFNSTGIDAYCSITAFANGTEMTPGDGLGYAYDSTTQLPGFAGAFNGWHSLASSREITVGPGTYFISVQAATDDSSARTTFWIGERTMHIEVLK
jgi:hypothetical protein